MSTSSGNRLPRSPKPTSNILFCREMCNHIAHGTELDMQSTAKRKEGLDPMSPSGS